MNLLFYQRTKKDLEESNIQNGIDLSNAKKKHKEEILDLNEMMNTQNQSKQR